MFYLTRTFEINTIRKRHCADLDSHKIKNTIYPFNATKRMWCFWIRVVRANRFHYAHNRNGVNIFSICFYPAKLKANKTLRLIKINK